MAARIRELGIDLLVDLKGATYDTLLPVLAQRPAPLQATWLGFPGTTGAPYIDYLIGDRVVTPLADAAHFSEKIAQLPHCYQPNDARRVVPQPSTRADWGVPEEALLLCAFHQSYKISAAVFDQWCALLHALPGSVLWLLQWNTNVQAALTKAAAERGIDAERLVFAPVLPLEGHLSRLSHADVYLDAWPCNAHTTAGEALWVGVPVVTIEGPTFAQRVASQPAAHLGPARAGVQRRRRLSRHRRRAGRRPGPARRPACAPAGRAIAPTGCSTARGFAADIEQLYRRMWQRAVAGERPEHLPAADLQAFARERDMKAVILAGGLGTRLAEETSVRPKPMVEIGGKPVLWHILKSYSHHGINEFVICLGYRGYLVKEYFANYFLHMSDVTFDLAENRMEVCHRHCEPWRVTLVDTGESTQTGGRLRRVRDYLDDGTFCFTYGDGLSNVDIGASIRFHREQKRLATLTAVQPAGRFGALDIVDKRITRFEEKPQGDGSWINGGFFVLEPEVLKHIEDDATVWEREPLERLARDGQLSAFTHRGFWQPMDTLRDKMRLEDLWQSGTAPWKVWA